MSAQPPARILLVDDNDLSCQALLAVLRREGFAVEHAVTGEQALRLARNRPDLVILDVRLPDIDGFEVCRRIKAGAGPRPPLVLHLSGHFISSDDRIQGLEGGADAYLIKPVHPRELLAHVQALLRIRAAEDALRASEERLQAILDAAPVLVHVKDRQGRYLLVNRCWEEFFHLQRCQVVGRTPYDVYPRERADDLLANDLRVLRARAPLEFEEIIPHDDGLHTYLSVKFPLRDVEGNPYAVCGISTDITERKMWERALRDSEALYHSLVENLPVCLFVKDREGRFTFANRNFCAGLRRPLEAVLGRTDHDFYPAELADKYVRDDRRVLGSGEVFEDVEEHPDAEGMTTYVEVLKAPVRDGEGAVSGMQGIFWDVTARRQAEEQLGRAVAEFRVARRIQQKLFPTTTPRVAGMDVAAASFGFDVGGASFPAEAIGGDYYDYLALPDGSLGIAIGDVSGHGLGPALLMAETRAYLRAFAHTNADVGAVLGLVNRVLMPDIEGDRFITLLLARLDPRGHTLDYASAGHSTGYVFDARGEIKASLRSTAIPLGIDPDTVFPCHPALRLEAGDLVLLLTDGVVESRAPDGSAFGTQRAIDLVRHYRDACARAIVENLYHAVRAFAQNMPQFDDITATIIKVESR